MQMRRKKKKKKEEEELTRGRKYGAIECGLSKLAPNPLISKKVDTSEEEATLLTKQPIILYDEAVARFSRLISSIGGSARSIHIYYSLFRRPNER